MVLENSCFCFLLSIPENIMLTNNGSIGVGDWWVMLMEGVKEPQISIAEGGSDEAPRGGMNK